MKTTPSRFVLLTCLSVLLSGQAWAEPTASQNYDLGLTAANDHRYSRSFEHFLDAAKAGNRDAQRTVALMLFYGERVYGNEIHEHRAQAIDWFKLAASGGCETSAHMLRKLAI